jgi:hypothetical protein
LSGMRRLRTRSLAAAGATLVVVMSLSLAGGAAAQTPPPKACVPAPGQVQVIPINNVEAILDDSASMRVSDPNGLRVAGLELFVTDPENKKKTLGVVEFGSDADTVFGPLTVGTNRPFMINRLRTRLVGDNNGTDYDAGFLKARQDNPGAEARIFVTDGVPKDGFSNSHRGGPRTFVVGIGIGSPGPGRTNPNRLQRIADETGGVYFPDVAAATLQPVYKTISAAINCLSPPRRFRSRRFTKKGQTSTRTVTLDPTTARMELAVTWGNPRNRFRLTRVDLLGPRNRVLTTLTGRGRPRILRRTSKKTLTSRLVRFGKAPPKATKLRFQITATRIARPARTISLLSEREQ